MTNVPTTLDEHRAYLRHEFLSWLIEQRPTSVLDLGAGDGGVVAALHGRGIDAAGIEADGPALERAHAEGRAVSAGRIDVDEDPLPPADWVLIRHVLHHLESPEVALRRAARAAQTGLMIADPVSTTGLVQHGWTQRLEALTRGLDRRRGMRHDADWTPDRMTVALAEILGPGLRAEVRIYAPLTALSEDEVQFQIQRSQKSMALTPQEAEEAAALLDAAAKGLVVPSGSAVVLARKVGA